VCVKCSLNMLNRCFILLKLVLRCFSMLIYGLNWFRSCWKLFNGSFMSLKLFLWRFQIVFRQFFHVHDGFNLFEECCIFFYHHSNLSNVVLGWWPVDLYRFVCWNQAYVVYQVYKVVWTCFEVVLCYSNWFLDNL
jgi:hypothetical protein